jgi:Txe/YoeB family toxin of Txe-Axe toxin-antitoxin module
MTAVRCEADEQAVLFPLVPFGWSRPLTLDHRVVHVIHDARVELVQGRYDC